MYVNIKVEMECDEREQRERNLTERSGGVLSEAEGIGIDVSIMYKEIDWWLIEKS